MVGVDGRAQAAGGAPVQLGAGGGEDRVQATGGPAGQGPVPVPGRLEAAGSLAREGARGLPGSAHAGGGAPQDVLRGLVEGARDVPVPNHVQGRQENVHDEVVRPGAAGHEAAGDDEVHAPVGGAQDVVALLHAVHDVLGHLAAGASGSGEVGACLTGGFLLVLHRRWRCQPGLVDWDRGKACMLCQASSTQTGVKSSIGGCMLA